MSREYVDLKTKHEQIVFVPKDIKLLTEEMESGIQTYIITKLNKI